MDDNSAVIDFLRRTMRGYDSNALVDALLLGSRSGELPAGRRLPTIAALGAELGLSASTVSRSWASLIQLGVIETRRRGGTFIATPIDATSYRSRNLPLRHFTHSLAAGYPDADLLVDLNSVLVEVAQRGTFRGYPEKDDISDTLRSQLLGVLGYVPEVLGLYTDVIGSLPLVLQAVTHRGSTVGISDPDFPLYGSILRQAGLTAAPIPFREGAYSLEAVEQLLGSGVRVLMLQTRVHNPTGMAVLGSNLEQIAGLLRTAGATAIEVDHHVGLAPRSGKSLAALAPERVVLLTSFAKAIHPDIRVISISGPASIMERIAVWRNGGRWVSAINKEILDICLNSAEVQVKTQEAEGEYARRRGVFSRAFADVGHRITSNAGLSLWLPVDDEQETMMSLASQGISVARGSAFYRLPQRSDYIHVSLGSVGRDCAALAATIAESSRLRARTPGDKYFL